MEAEQIYVEVGEMTKAQSPDTLWTDGLGPCIAVAVYDPVTKSGYMMHTFLHVSLEPQIQKIKNDYGDLSRLRVFVTGDSMSLYGGVRQDDDFDLSGRSYVEEIITNYFDKRRTTIQWLPDDQCGELHLDTSTGKFKVESERLEELLSDEP